MKILRMTILFSLLLNLSTIHEWLSQKEANPNTQAFLKLTESLRDIGNVYYLNYFRDSIRTQIFPLSKETLAAVNPTNVIVPNNTDRNLAAIDPTPIADDEELIPIDMTEIDFVDDIVDETENPNQAVLVLGDSILKSGLQEHFQRNLKNRGRNFRVETKSKSGTGLSRPDVFNWVDYIEKSTDVFDKVIVFLGTNDAQNLKSGKKIISFGSKDWRLEYALRVRSLIEKSCEKANQVVWVGSLRMKSDNFDSKIQFLNETVRKEINSRPSCARFISVNNWFTKKSKYVENWTIASKSSAPKVIKLRAADGIHLTYWGADLFSQRLIESIYE